MNDFFVSHSFVFFVYTKWYDNKRISEKTTDICTNMGSTSFGIILSYNTPFKYVTAIRYEIHAFSAKSADVNLKLKQQCVRFGTLLKWFCICHIYLSASWYRPKMRQNYHTKSVDKTFKVYSDEVEIYRYSGKRSLI